MSVALLFVNPYRVNIKAAQALEVFTQVALPGPRCSACSPRSGSGAACWARGYGTAAARRWARASGRTGRTARSRKGRAARRSSSRVPSPRAGRRLHTRRTWDRGARKHTHIPHTHAHTQSNERAVVQSPGPLVREGGTDRRREEVVGNGEGVDSAHFFLLFLFSENVQIGEVAK